MRSRCPRTVWPVVAAALLTAPIGASAGDEPAVTQVRYIMGTLWEVAVFTSDDQLAEGAIGAAFSEIDRLDRLMSNYKDESELSRLNREARKGPVKVDPELLAVVKLSLGYSRLSGGAFDITVGPLMRAWGFFKAEGRLPTEDELAQARAGVGFSKVVVDSGSGTIQFSASGVELDLGAIGKGYAVDRAVEVLKKRGISKAVVNAGGNLYVLGDLPASRSAVGVQHPRDEGLLATIRLRGMAVATSGDYEKFFVVDGKRYSHIMDPRTGRPVAGTVSATVVSRTATDADALSTAVYILGPKEGVRLVESLPGVECLIVYETEDGGLQTVESSGWRDEVGECKVQTETLE